MRITLAKLKPITSAHPEFRRGCVVDTNVLFAALVPPDHLNAWAEAAFIRMEELGLPAYTNPNIRAEFIELQRRVLIPEGLVSLYDSPLKDRLDTTVRTRLRSLKTSMDQAIKDVAYVVERLAPGSRFVLVCECDEEAA